MAHDVAVATISFDDGGWQDREVIGELGARGLRATFYLVGHLLLESVYDGMDADEIRELYRQQEIGGHTRSHRRLTMLQSWEVEDDIDGGRDDLARFFHVPASSIRCFAYPYGAVCERAALVLDKLGMKYGRTCRRGVVDEVCSKRLGAYEPITAIARPRNEPWEEQVRQAKEKRADIHLVSHAWELVKHKMIGRFFEVVDGIVGAGYHVVPNGEFAGV